MRVLLCASPVDMRRSFDSLASLVIERLDEDPTAGDTLFVFVNAARDKVKLLWRDESGGVPPLQALGRRHRVAAGDR